MSLKSWVLRKLAEREIEKLIERLKKGDGMKVGTGVQVLVAGVVTAAAVTGLDAGVDYLKTHTGDAFAWAEMGRAVAVAALGGVLLWLRSPKDKQQPPQLPPSE